MEPIKKARKNFSRIEEDVLVDLVDEVKDIVLNKETNGTAWREKEIAWRQVAVKFTAKTGTTRPWKSLREKFEAMKRRSKSELALVKAGVYRTGGGLLPPLELSPLAGKVLEIMGASTDGLGKCPDTDFHKVRAATFMDTDCGTDAEEENQIRTIDDEVSNIPVMATERKIVIIDGEQDSTSVYAPQHGNMPIEVDQPGTPNNWSNYELSQLRQPTSSKFAPLGGCQSMMTSTKEELMAAQRDFYLDENRRCKEQHQASMERHQAEMERHQAAMERHQAEMELLHIKIETERMRLEQLWAVPADSPESQG